MRSAKLPECVYVLVTLTTLASLASRAGSLLRHVLQDTANSPPPPEITFAVSQAARVCLCLCAVR